MLKYPHDAKQPVRWYFGVGKGYRPLVCVIYPNQDKYQLDLLKSIEIGLTDKGYLLIMEAIKFFQTL